MAQVRRLLCGSVMGVQSTLGSLRIPMNTKGAEGALLSATISWPVPGTQIASTSSAAGFAEPFTSTEGTITAILSKLIPEKQHILKFTKGNWTLATLCRCVLKWTVQNARLRELKAL